MASVKELLLASGSSFRKALLDAAGVRFRVRTAEVDEYAIRDDDPQRLALKRAEAKALAVAALEPGRLVIGADQVLSLGTQTFDKAKDRAEAKLRLTQLAGQVHHLHSAVALCFRADDADEARLVERFVVDCAMPMRPLAEAEIEAYLDTGEWQGCVGCYQYENRGVHLLHGVAAEHSAIVGLPMTALLGSLRRLGIDTLRSPGGPWEAKL
jgi:septum formation protein